MKILVTGVTGQLGYDVFRQGVKMGFDMVGIGSKDLDITKEADVSQRVTDIKPDAIIHCAAYTAVDKAEDNQEICWDINVNGTKYLANAAKSNNAKFMYISTDYVFDGLGETPFLETDSPNPAGIYGMTKFEGEKQVRTILEKFYIIRISWVFGINGENFVKTMLKLSETNTEVNVVGDQIGSPTYTYDLAQLLLEVIQESKYGVYHASNEGFCSWAEFAKEIFKLARKNVKINSISTDKYPTKALRPKNSRLSKQRLRDNDYIFLPTWQDALKRYLKELTLEVK